MKRKQKSSNKDELKKRSRPCKKTKKSIGAGGKRVPIEEASNRMFRRRAKELLSTGQCNSRTRKRDRTVNDGAESERCCH